MQVALNAAPPRSLEPSFVASLDALLVANAAQQFPAAPRFAVAVSGGADSMALALLAQHYCTVRGGEMVALTVDHRLRPESSAEALQVQHWLRARGIRHHILTPEHTETSNNLQEAARTWRYEALAAWCRQAGMLHCLIAHHAGDNRETLLHQQARDGSAERAGMPRVRLHHGVRFLRPLLGVERTPLEAHLQHNSQAWVEDPSNRNTVFARVRNRQQLENPALRMATEATLLQMRPARTTHDHLLATAAVNCVSIHPLGHATLALEPWRHLTPALREALLADCLTTISGAARRPRIHETRRLADALLQCITRRTLLHCELRQQGSSLLIARELSRVEAPCLLEGSGVRRWDRRFVVRHDLPVGTRFTVRALGRDGRTQLGKSGSALPLSTPSLWHLDELLHVPYINDNRRTLDVTIGFAPLKPLAATPFW